MSELIRIDNILKLLRRGKWELSGEEILAFQQCFQYLLDRHKQLSKPEPVAAPALAVVAPVLKSPITKRKKSEKTNAVE